MTRRSLALNALQVQRDFLNGSGANQTTSASPPHSPGTLTPDTLDSDSFKMADAMSILTKGALYQSTVGTLEVDQPVVQCVQIKPMNNQGGQERWRVVMSDSVNFMQGMLGQQLNYMIHENKLQKGNICRLSQFQTNFVKDKHILVILELEILDEYGLPEKLGQPVAIAEKAPDGMDGIKQESQQQPGNIAGNGFYGNRPQTAQQPQQPQQQQRSLASRPGGNSAHTTIYPIEALSPYTHRWTIKARCTHKGEIKTWHKASSEGKLFSCNFLDDTGEIRATGFNEAVDAFYELLQEGSVYYVSNPCRVQMAKKQFSNVNHDYELTFEKDTQIEKAEDADGVPTVTFNFTGIADLQNIEKDSTIDCIGILQDVGEVQEIVSKTTSKPYQKRELTLVDNTGYNVRLTIWGKTAQSFEVQPESVVAFKGVKVGDFGGRTLSLLSSGSMTVDPDIEQAYTLKGWYDGAGRTQQFQSHANTMSAVGATGGNEKNAVMNIASIKDSSIGMGEETDWFSTKATIIYIKQDSVSYPACQSEGCNKKVVEVADGQWRCEKCDKTWERPNYRYIMTLNVSDHTGQIWLSCFDDVGQQLMGMTANDLMAMKEEGEDRKVADAFQEAMCKTFVFRCKAKMDSFQDQQRIRYQVQYANPLDFSREANKLAAIIKQYSFGEANGNSNGLFVT